VLVELATVRAGKGLTCLDSVDHSHDEGPLGPKSALILEPAHEHQWPHERVALGCAVYTAAEVAALRAEGITHVLDCRSESDAWRLYRDARRRVLPQRQQRRRAPKCGADCHSSD
jgi:hypothetical protein